MGAVADLNIAVTLPGEGALGTFEAGAMSALIIAAQAGEAIEVDILTGASSGALTSVIAAAALLTRSDPVAPLRRAWVTEPSLASLRDAQLRAPLSLQRARSVGHSVLAEMLLDGLGVGGATQPEVPKVTVECALTCLRGHTSKITADDVIVTSYLDWANFEFTDGDLAGVTKKWSTALDSAIASASLPLAFAPSLLERPAEPGDEVSDLAAGADGNRLWYADGGLVNREPLRRCIRLARQADTDAPVRRRVLVVRPSPEDAPGRGDPAWTGAGDPPRYRESLERALRILVTHNVYEDLRTVEATNSRVSVSRELARALAQVIPDSDEVRQILAKAVPDSDGACQTPVVDATTPEADLAAWLEQLLQAATGLGGKTNVDVDVVAPGHAFDLARGAASLTAERIRATDFLLGYQAMLEWMKGQLEPEKPAEAERTSAAVDAVRRRAATIPGWLPDLPTGRRPLRVSAQLARLGVRALRAGLTNPRAADSN
jgi:predicted acylesterase/phospholipase RssA